MSIEKGNFVWLNWLRGDTALHGLPQNWGKRSWWFYILKIIFLKISYRYAIILRVSVLKMVHVKGQQLRVMMRFELWTKRGFQHSAPFCPHTGIVDGASGRIRGKGDLNHNSWAGMTHQVAHDRGPAIWYCKRHDMQIWCCSWRHDMHKWRCSWQAAWHMIAHTCGKIWPGCGNSWKLYGCHICI